MSKGPVYAMAISPHPADNDFGVGGTVSKWIREGKKVVYFEIVHGPNRRKSLRPETKENGRKSMGSV